MCLLITRSYQPFRPHAGGDGVLFRLGEPEETVWFREGRPASREEVAAAIDASVPDLAAPRRSERPDATLGRARGRDKAAAVL